MAPRKPITLRGRYCVRGAGVYAIRHVATGRVYVGGTVNLRQRACDHERGLIAGVHRNSLLQAAWLTEGPGGFEFVVLEIVVSHADLLAREQHYIDALGAYQGRGGFNLVPRAGTQLGLVMPEAAKASLSEQHKGMRASDAARARMSETARALWQEPEHRAHMLAKRSETRGVKLSPEHCERMSVALKGKTRTQEQCERIGASKRGIPLSSEHRAKVSAALRARVCSEETRRKRSESMLRTLAAKRGRAA
jgi:group I intron endonuclease